ncbi:calcium-translocating P-type ATPase, PMCA-type [Paraclostridium sordellii]|uniref:calcium-translocating P-type ATPase, PMCA-type n=1 Tax=Paraclostridium sordellii TaxID=1505 RepID=UPI0005E7D4B5|nr:calcium-translocating P-type ATPase, PMCA-type [Paeniclostridium sordellii]CEO08754.1 calcium-transporting ATPase [[Clostridium] sordellii] [Paeniclostridium sordellii]CEP87329.1 calcium-transporting ATPase [[Clostridium] sordellii] [Paeniclostridium sordellii]CEP95672.1 calcium-transporting ATPase [[Clostridium] sordellii] [Paeniclostridium sordellii]CEP98990.1 calcium-transporting ATPase [[Clostridium] sordellii] [Paeniclostridium sordellii]
MRYYSKSTNETLKYLKVNPEIGLSNSDIEERRHKYGYNEFKIKEGKSLLESISDSIMEPMILILLGAAVISAFVGEAHDAFGILGAIILGLSIGAATESKSKKAAQALSKLTENIEVKVLRNGKIHQISKKDLVPGDIVYIESGNMIPADGRLIQSINLKLREDMLTGESADVLKNADEIVDMDVVYGKTEIIEQDTIPAKQANMVFGGTLVAYGRGIMVVTTIGDKTEMGKIAQNIGDDDIQTPLQLKLGKLGARIAIVSGIIAFLLCMYMIMKMNLNGTIKLDTSGIIPFLKSLEPAKEAYMVCIALIVATVPEGLPTMVNITLAITMQKMAKINALVTKKEACETIGCVSVICSDKTGTLTQNKMMVEVAYIDGKYIDNNDYHSNSYFEENCIVNSTADIEKDEKDYKYIGSATECALLLYHRNKDYNKFRKEVNLVSQVPFNSDKKRMSSLINMEDNGVFLSKGAPEVLLEKCAYIQKDKSVVALTPQMKKDILREIRKLQVKSMRTLGFAYKTIDKSAMQVALTYENELAISEDLGFYESAKDLIFGGFVGIVDPLRKGVKESIQIAYDAGVKVKMLTGDNINTAKAIGKEIGLLEDGKKAVEATYIDVLSDEELREEINDISIVARSKPDTKMRIVQALQANLEVVAVTGDGINDAPALSKADVGISMGISGTEVSKNASDIILTDDSFSTIVDGIKWGRGIYENFQRFIQFQLTVNIVAFMIAVISQIIGTEMPFTTIQLLWVNIIMDGPPALALGLEPVRDYVLKRKPIKRKASIIAKNMLANIIINAVLIISIVNLQSFFNVLNASPEEQGTVVFSVFAFSALFNALSCREFGLNSVIPNFFKNKLALYVIFITGIVQVLFTQVFRSFFNSVALSNFMWIKIILLSSMVLILNEAVKFILRVMRKQGHMVRNIRRVN